MKPADIKPRASYVNKSGRAERLVLDRGAHVKVLWMGDDTTEPTGEDGILFIETRMGNTHYGERSGKRPTSMYVSAFASWAARELPSEEASHNYSDAAITRMVADATR